MANTHVDSTGHARKRVVQAAATAVTAENPHEVDAAPEVLDLTDAQKDLIRSLHFLSSYEISHTPKVAPDVINAFDDSTVTTIEQHPELGGQSRADRIRASKAQHADLLAVAQVVGPIARLVGQALMVVDASLAREAGEPLKVAHALHRSQPALLEGLAALDRWSSLHHRGGGAAPAPASTTSGAKAAMA